MFIRIMDALKYIGNKFAPIVGANDAFENCTPGGFIFFNFYLMQNLLFTFDGVTNGECLFFTLFVFVPDKMQL